MDSSSQEVEGKKKITEVKTFPIPFVLGEINKKEDRVCNKITFTVPFSLDEIKENITITTQLDYNISKEEIINQAFNFHSQGYILEAIKYYQLFINRSFIDYRIFSNYGAILRDLGNLKEAELC